MESLDMCLCTGDKCPIKGDCWRWEGNRDCPDDCEGLSFFIKPPFADGECKHYDPMARHRGRKDNGQP